MRKLPIVLSTLLAAFTGLGFITAGSASAAPSGSDLAPTFVATPTRVYDVAHYDVRITNTGNRNSGAVNVAIQLPKTNTSPTVTVMGTVSGITGGCSLSGTRILCSIPAGIARNQTAQVGFDIRLPYSTNPLTFRADVTTNNDGNLANNTSTTTASQTNWTVPAPTATTLVTNSHCSGTNLSSFFECALYPSSISTHQVNFVPTSATAGTIDFSPVGAQGTYSGTYAVNGSQLTFVYLQNGQPYGTFSGQGTAANCWEGIMNFPTNMAVYKVCL